MRKTKIICTVGPATDEDAVLKSMMLAGMNVARFNFSHSSHEEHLKRFEQVKRIREELALPSPRFWIQKVRKSGSANSKMERKLLCQEILSP